MIAPLNVFSNQKQIHSVNLILKQAEAIKDWPVEKIQSDVRGLKYRVQSGEPFSSVLVPCFAYAFEAIRRILEIEPYPVQMRGGMTMAAGGIAEMQTGEGKTVTAIFPTALYTLAGRGVHVVTTNDYLAERDAGELQNVYHMLGLSVGCVKADMETEARRLAYSRDITYGTSKEMGFDFLRDRIRLGADFKLDDEKNRYFSHSDGSSETLVQRGQFCAIVDEADSVLIDDARTPLIIGAAAPQTGSKVSLFRWCDYICEQLCVEKDYIVIPRERRVFVTEEGCLRIAVLGKPRLADTIDQETFLEHIERMLECKIFFIKDRHYTVMNDEIVLVDESTGRIMEGRKLQGGLHHCLESKEGLPISAQTKTTASITVQSFFRGYRFLGGMTGTAWSSRGELYKTYRLRVNRIPTHRPCLRKKLKSRVFVDMNSKYEAIVKSVIKKLKEGRSTLIGTPSVGASESLGRFFEDAEIPYQILNAKNESQEAEIVKDAAQNACVTIATNMAGRGTDIKLSEEVRSAGGLHVIATEQHSSARIDRQLVGRAGRQGDPGSFQFFLCLEDELFIAVSSDKIQSYRESAEVSGRTELPHSWVSIFEKTQNRLERLHKKQRKQILKQEEKQFKTYRRIGLNPYLEAVHD